MTLFPFSAFSMLFVQGLSGNSIQKKKSVFEYKLLFKQDTFQAAKRTFTELNTRFLSEKEN